MTTLQETLAIGLEHHQAGRLQTAEDIYRQILQVEPNEPDAIHLLGLIAHQMGQHEMAAQYIARAIELRPGVAPFHNNLGEAYRALGRMPEAMACYRHALELSPDYSQALNNLGITLQNQGHLDQAIGCCLRALELSPNYAEAHNNLGNALQQRHDLNRAIACYRRALELNPDFLKAHNNLGHALGQQGKLDEAITCYRQALQRNPDYASAHTNLGNAYQHLQQYEEAAAWHRRALELEPGSAEAHNNLGLAFQFQARFNDAAECFRRAVELQPDFAWANWNQSCLRLLTGDFGRGWPQFEWRWKTGELIPRDFPQPRWDGRPLSGKTILLHAEQGLGDTLQFIRYAPLVKDLGASVLLECPPELERILHTCPGIDQILTPGSELPPFDVHAPLMSLPAIFKTTLATVPARVPYLSADAALVERWKQELGAYSGFKVGIVWQGNPRSQQPDCRAADRRRSIPLSCFEPLARVPGVRLFSLQKGFGSEQLAEWKFPWNITDLGDKLHDFMDTAAVMMNLDLVISADTSPLHLAGALGRPVWAALPFVPCWRWLTERPDSPWYPTMRLFRQKSPGDWVGVFAEIQHELAALLGSRWKRKCPEWHQLKP